MYRIAVYRQGSISIYSNDRFFRISDYKQSSNSLTATADSYLSNGRVLNMHYRITICSGGSTGGAGGPCPLLLSARPPSGPPFGTLYPILHTLSNKWLAPMIRSCHPNGPPIRQILEPPLTICSQNSIFLFTVTQPMPGAPIKGVGWLEFFKFSSDSYYSIPPHEFKSSG